MSIWGIIVLCLVGLLIIYEIYSIIMTLVKRKRLKKVQEQNKVNVNNVIKDSSEDTTEVESPKE